MESCPWAIDTVWLTVLILWSRVELERGELLYLIEDNCIESINIHSQETPCPHKFIESWYILVLRTHIGLMNHVHLTSQTIRPRLNATETRNTPPCAFGYSRTFRRLFIKLLVMFFGHLGITIYFFILYPRIFVDPIPRFFSTPLFAAFIQCNHCNSTYHQVKIWEPVDTARAEVILAVYLYMHGCKQIPGLKESILYGWNGWCYEEKPRRKWFCTVSR